MDTRQSLEESLKESLRSKDEVRKKVIRLALSSIKFADSEKGVKIDDAAVQLILQKEIKTRRESITEAEKGGRADLVADAEQEIIILETFLPAQLSDDELMDLVVSAIAETGAAAVSDTGKVMKVLVPKLQGRASNDRVSQAVRRKLAAL